MNRLALCALASIALLCGHSAFAADDYKPGPDSERKEGVPKGAVTQHKFNDSKIYPGIERDYWVYVPAQYKPEKPACVMVFQDGQSYVNEKGQFRVPVVFDNLIAAGQMPVTIAILINPGNDPKKNPPLKPGEKRDPGRPWRPSNRSFEYDTLSDQYARFLIDEILPEVAKSYKLTDDPAGRAICGSSSGGICAFTVAWERPDVFRKVVSHIGSFTAIAYRPATADKPMQPGGDLYPALVRRTKDKPRPIRVFLQDGSNDLDNQFGNWFLANQQMAAALKYAGYDHKTEWGDGAHNGKHGGAILPDTLRWLWRDYPAAK